MFNNTSSTSHPAHATQLIETQLMSTPTTSGDAHKTPAAVSTPKTNKIDYYPAEHHPDLEQHLKADIAADNALPEHSNRAQTNLRELDDLMHIMNQPFDANFADDHIFEHANVQVGQHLPDEEPLLSGLPSDNLALEDHVNPFLLDHLVDSNRAQDVLLVEDIIPEITPEVQPFPIHQNMPYDHQVMDNIVAELFPKLPDTKKKRKRTDQENNSNIANTTPRKKKRSTNFKASKTFKPCVMAMTPVPSEVKTHNVYKASTTFKPCAASMPPVASTIKQNIYDGFWKITEGIQQWVIDLTQ